MSYQDGLLPIIEQHKNELIKKGWYNAFAEFIKTDDFTKLNHQLIMDSKNFNIYPLPQDIFNALLLTSINDVNVIILGMDPYHTPGAANGLAFSTNKKPQPSLLNIYKEVEANGFTVNYESGNLIKWAEQGVLLINTALTVKQGKPGSYISLWQPFTILLCQLLVKNKDHLVVMLWGKQAQAYESFLLTYDLLMTSHPSPHSAYIGFTGCKHFKICNELLKKYQLKPIDWSL